MSAKKDLPLSVLGGISAEHFLNEYWQKKPLLIRQAFPGFECPVDPDELAGLSLEEEIESRIIVEHGSEGAWQLRNGPFCEADYRDLPESHWTLLIQQLDAWVPEINLLKQHFNFIPNWRIDDIMASYAPIGGSVGPHFDQYDVFLIQALGHREWQTGQNCSEPQATLDGTPLRILATFENENTWTLAPGDMLYLPPKLAHHGIAQDDCITLSVGFRAPTKAQLIDDFSLALSEDQSEEAFYEDPDLSWQDNAGEVTHEAMGKVNQMLDSSLNDPLKRANWFLRFITEPKNPAILNESDSTIEDADLDEIIQENQTLYQNEGSRFAYYCCSQHVLLGVDGQVYTLPTEALDSVKRLCESASLPAQSLLGNHDNPAMYQTIIRLLREGNLYCT